MRDREIDIVRGILILLVVIGHGAPNIAHDIIFLFHMPLFFVLSGVLLQRKCLLQVSYIKKKIFDLMIPYLAFLTIDFLLIRRLDAPIMLVRMLYGGRSISGVYWYMTCYVSALIIFHLIVSKFSDKSVKCIILAGGGIAVLESHLVERIHYLQSPGMPWNIDVSLMALVYIGIGFFYKTEIKTLIKESSQKCDIIAGITAILLVFFCMLNYYGGRRFYYFDMKPVYYKELLSAIIIPCAFGLVVVRGVHLMKNIGWFDAVLDFLSICGRATIPIMFMHIPLNYWRNSFGYGWFTYLLIGVGVPLIFSLLFNRIPIMRKIFGLPDLSQSCYKEKEHAD